MFEKLESRTMFATTAPPPSISVDALGTLTVTGTTSADVLKVSEANGTVTVTSGSTVMGKYLSITAIAINGGAGNDTITYTGYSMGAAISGGDGADIIYVTDPDILTTAKNPFSNVSGGLGADKITVYNGLG